MKISAVKITIWTNTGLVKIPKYTKLFTMSKSGCTKRHTEMERTCHPTKRAGKCEGWCIKKELQQQSPVVC